MYGEVGQERFDLGFGGDEVLTGPHAVETNKPHDPFHVGSLSDFIEELWLLAFLSSQAYKTSIMQSHDR